LRCRRSTRSGWRPIYAKTAAYGHFGRDDHDFTWERTDKVSALRAAAGLEQKTPA
jgi:S-adenosylmethionine synthetase